MIKNQQQNSDYEDFQKQFNCKYEKIVGVFLCDINPS